MLTVVTQVSVCCGLILFPTPCNICNFSVSCNALRLNMFCGRSTDNMRLMTWYALFRKSCEYITEVRVLRLTVFNLEITFNFFLKLFGEFSSSELALKFPIFRHDCKEIVENRLLVSPYRPVYPSACIRATSSWWTIVRFHVWDFQRKFLILVKMEQKRWTLFMKTCLCVWALSMIGLQMRDNVLCQLRTWGEETIFIIKTGCVLCAVRTEVEETVQHRAWLDAKVD
jgi:hypothetical protein